MVSTTLDVSLCDRSVKRVIGSRRFIRVPTYNYLSSFSSVPASTNPQQTHYYSAKSSCTLRQRSCPSGKARCPQWPPAIAPVPLSPRGLALAVMCASTHMWAEGAAAACERCNISLGGVPNQARIILHAARLPFTILLRSVWPDPGDLCKYCCLRVIKLKNFCKMKAKLKETWSKNYFQRSQLVGCDPKVGRGPVLDELRTAGQKK